MKKNRNLFGFRKEINSLSIQDATTMLVAMEKTKTNQELIKAFEIMFGKKKKNNK